MEQSEQTMDETFARSRALLGENALEKLKNSHVAVVGLGGVGSYVAEALARTGVGALTLIDGDTVGESNINRQLYALHSTVGRYKTELAQERIADINPFCRVAIVTEFLPPDFDLDLSPFDYVVDAVDDVPVKIALAVKCKEQGIPLVSSMGTGNKMDPTQLQIIDIFQTQNDPLAKSVRQKLRRAGIDRLTVVFSEETPKKEENTGYTPASCIFVPATAGLLLANYVVKELIYERTDKSTGN